MSYFFEKLSGCIALASTASLIAACDSPTEPPPARSPGPVLATGPGMSPLPGKTNSARKNERSLPLARTDGGMSLDRALAARRSVRRFARRDLSPFETGQLLWAGQGVTSRKGFRTAPSAGALFPLEIHLLDANGVFRYDPNTHRLERLAAGDSRADLANAALGQTCVRQAAADIVISGIVSRTSRKYGERAARYVAIEAGAAAQNILLEAVALDLGAVLIGAFHDKEVRDVAMLPDESVPFGIVAVGPLP